MEPLAIETLLFIGFLITPLISLLKKATWAAEAKQAVAIATSVAAAVAATYIENKGLSWDLVLANSTVIFGATQAFYTQFFESSKSENVLKTKLVK